MSRFLRKIAIIISAVILTCSPVLAVAPLQTVNTTAGTENLTSDALDAIDPNLNQRHQSGRALPPVSDVEMSVAALEVYLDRIGISPGAIDGYRNGYLDSALAVYREATGASLNFEAPGVLADELERTGGPAFARYTITAADVAGPFLTYLPSRIQDQARFQTLGFTSPLEKLAERFHMDERFLKRLNPNADFALPGTKITVAQVGRPLDIRVHRVVADTSKRKVYAYAKDGALLAIYPASIGSAETPSPEGVFKVRNKAGNPFYTLSPNNSFEKMDRPVNVRIAPGPNNPVGTAWIGLSKPTYGIHGTPEPSLVGTAQSSGCIRLTNWDALELARLVSTGVEVVID